MTFYITGSDGSGKTTILNDVEKELIAQSKKTKHVWIRSPKITSKPLMAYCRLVGLTTYKIIDGIKYGKHEFYKSSFVSWLFPILQLLDFKIKWYFEKRKIKSDEILLFDRFSLDTLADLMVDTKRLDLHKTNIGKAFIDLIPKNTKILIPIVDENTIRARKKDTLHDEHLADKIKVYSILIKDLKIKSIDNNRDYTEVKKDVFNYLEIYERS
ncbi:MAG: hypothetical protein KAJ28_12510 [Flavobacteriaceae bacterium]|nr:hypothetical protein [Flavobacteriaceae bacterium]